MSLRVVIDQKKVSYANKEEETTYTYEVTHHAEVPDSKTMAAVLRSIADVLDPPKSTSY